MNNIITGKSNEDALYALGAEIDERIPKTKTAEEKAFLLGHLNLLAAMLKPVVENDHCKGFKLNLNYKTALKLYKEANEQIAKQKDAPNTDILKGQMSIEELVEKTIKKLFGIDKETVKSTKHKKD